MKVWYLHGLESAPGGPKVDFLKEVADEVYAPAMDYTSHKAFGELYREITKKGKPDLIIGSSMGGYFADAIASHFGIKTILFNPALHSRSIERNLPYGNDIGKRVVVLGDKDDVIDPHETFRLLTNVEYYAGESPNTFIWVNNGHRTPLTVFKDIYTKIVFDEIS